MGDIVVILNVHFWNIMIDILNVSFVIALGWIPRHFSGSKSGDAFVSLGSKPLSEIMLTQI